jgi:hypothetical protein
MPVSVKRQAVKKYFAPFPKWAAWLVGLGVVALVIGFNNQPALIFIGLIMTGAGGFGVYSFSTGKPTDAEMDKILAEDLLNAQTKALQGTGAEDITLEGDPVVVTGPRFWDTGGAPILFKKGGDNKLRFTPVNVTVLNMTEHQLLAYQAALDLTTGNFLSTSTDEYFYRDVVSVSTKTTSKTVTLPNKGTVQLDAAQTFVLTTSGGTSLETILRDPKLIEMMGGGEIPTTDADRAIANVRRMLRDKKAA